MLSRLIYGLLLVNGLLTMVGCQTGTITSPKAPAEVYLHTKMEIQNEKYRSTVNVPVEISMADVSKQLNAQVQGLIYEDNSYEDDQDQFKLKVWKRAPIQVQVRDSLFYYTVPLKIWAEKGYKLNVLGQTLAGYRDTEFEINLHFMTAFGVAANWQVVTKTASAGFDWVTKPNIKVAGIDVPITSIVSRKISDNLEKLSGDIDNNIRDNFVIKPYVLQAWNVIREPRLISEEYHTWLVVSPTDISMTPFSFQNNHLKATIAIRGFTQTAIGNKPTVIPVTSLPPLTIAATVSQGFQIGLVGTVSYLEATKLAVSKFVGQTFQFQDGKYKIEVTSVDIYGQNEKLIVKAGLKGSIDGTIYLKGIPTYDPQSRQVSLKNVDYDLATKNLLYKTANWFLQGRFAKQIEKQFVFPIGDQMDEAQKAIQQQLTNRTLGKGVTLVGRLENIQPDQVYLTPESLVAVIFAKGNLQIKIDGLL